MSLSELLLLLVEQDLRTSLESLLQGWIGKGFGFVEACQRIAAEGVKLESSVHDESLVEEDWWFRS